MRKKVCIRWFSLSVCVGFVILMALGCQPGLCPEGQSLCDGKCVDLTSEALHCGACGQACLFDQRCHDGVCEDKGCPVGQTNCNGDCVNINQDGQHCGACGNVCAQEQVCNKGKCALVCPDNLTRCDSSCIDTENDPQHCGTCSTVCQDGEICSRGRCTLTCPTGQEKCRDRCVVIASDKNNCGGCGIKCKDDQICNNGTCALECPDEFAKCDGACKDLQTDRDHCGACGKRCSQDQRCQDSACVLNCPTSLTICNGRCIDIRNNPAHCGGCDNRCQGGEFCSSGSCQVSCQAGWRNCDGTCQDIKNDPKHCGGCGSVCDDGSKCVDGRCQLTCPDGKTACDETCVDLKSDRDNCGSCGTKCAAGTQCNAGTCEACPDCPIRMTTTQGAGGASIFGIATDANGHSYVVGRFTGTVAFGKQSLTAQSSQLFVAKADATGAWLWAVAASGVTKDAHYSIAVDGAGNSYVTGSFDQTSASFGSTTLTNAGGTDIFVAKVKANGSWDWAISAGGAGPDSGRSIITDTTGHLYITGSFSASSGNAATFGGAKLTSNGDADIFVAKLSDAGQWRWRTSAGSPGPDGGVGLALSPSGDIYATGHFRDNAAFGTVSLRSKGSDDIFVARLDTTTGRWRWIASAGGADADSGHGLIVDARGAIYATGAIQGTADVSFGPTKAKAFGGGDIFVAKLSDIGAWQWVATAGGSGAEAGSDLAFDKAGNICLTGATMSRQIAFGKLQLTSAGSRDIFVAAVSPTGTWQQAIAWGGSRSDGGTSLASTPGGLLLIGGFYTAGATFGHLQMKGSTGQSGFVAALKP